MQLYFEQVPWMVSPPLVPDRSAIDLAHLHRMTLGEQELEHEVLALFTVQARELLTRLAVFPAEAAALAHTLKGAARAIGAFGVGDASQALERAIKECCQEDAALRDLGHAVAEACAEIDTILMARRS